MSSFDQDADLGIFHIIDPDSDRIANLRSMTQNYQRRMNRLKDEKAFLEKATELQLQLVEKLGINEDNLSVQQQPEKSPEKPQNAKEVAFYDGIHVSESLESLTKGDIDSFFLNCPFSLASFFEDRSGLVRGDAEKLGKRIANVTPESRSRFFRGVFAALNAIPGYLEVIRAIFDCETIHAMSEKVESLAPKVFGFKRVVLYEYNSETKRLVIVKQRLSMSNTLRLGLVCEAVKTGKAVFVRRGDTDVSQEDISLLNVYDSGYFVPVQNSNLVLAVFDKIDREFAPVDDLMVGAFAGIISEAFRTVSMRKKEKDRVISFQRICQVILELCEVSDIRNFIEVLARNLERVFVCESVCLFKVDGNVFSRAIENEQIEIGTGIVGRAIAKKEAMIVPNPELSLFFDAKVDRSDVKRKCSSIAVAPALDDSKNVKWAVALYNKHGSFSHEDLAGLEILCHFLNPVIVGIGKMNKDTPAMIEANQVTEDLSQMFSTFPLLDGLSGIENVAAQFAQKMKVSLELENTKLFVVDQKRKCLFRNGLQGGFSMKNTNRVVKAALYDNLAMHGTTIYCPIHGTDGKVVAISTHELASLTSMSSQSLDSDSSNEFVEVSSERMKKLLNLWSAVIGKFVEASSQNVMTDVRILSEQRAMDALVLVSPSVGSVIWQDLDAWFFHIQREKNENELVVLPATQCSEELARSYVTLVYSLTRFAGDCNLLDLKGERSRERLPVALSHTFPLTNQYDASASDEPEMNDCLIGVMENLNIGSFMALDRHQMEEIIVTVRKLHSDHKFKNWKLTVDRIQYLQYFLAKSGVGGKLADIEKAALFFYLLCLNCELGDGESTRRCLEGFGQCHIVSIVFIVVSAIKDNQFFLLEPESQSAFWETLKKFDALSNVDTLVSPDLPTMVAAACRFSYLSRQEDVTARYVKARLDTEFQSEPQQIRNDLMNCQLEFELRLVLLTVLDGISQLGYKVEGLRRQITDNVTKITNIDF